MASSDNDFDEDFGFPESDTLSKPLGRDVELELLREAFVEQGKVIGDLVQRVDGILKEIQVVKAALGRHSGALHKIMAHLTPKTDEA